MIISDDVGETNGEIVRYDNLLGEVVDRSWRYQQAQRQPQILLEALLIARSMEQQHQLQRLEDA